MNTEGVKQQAKERIRYARRKHRLPKWPRNFSLNTITILLIVVFVVAGVALQELTGPALSTVNREALVAFATTLLFALVLLALVPMWSIVLLDILAIWAAVGSYASVGLVPLLSVVSFGLFASPALQIVKQWDRAVVFRLGRYHRVLPPGPNLLMPIVDSVVDRVDTRIRVTDFSAESSVTRDTVPVNIDALAFWMVWDAGKAILEVEKYFDAVTLSAQAVLRDTIGRNDLATVLSERERLGAEIQETLDAKTSPWGITILSIEFTEVLLPKQLEDALSRKAQAERERQARVILSSAEVDIAEKFEEAGRRYEQNPQAFNLRAMNMVYDGMKENQNLMLIPTGAVESMGIGAGLGLAALRRTQQSDEPEQNDSTSHSKAYRSSAAESDDRTEGARSHEPGSDRDDRGTRSEEQRTGGDTPGSRSDDRDKA
ncbi:MAG: slipin family protein [Spirochaetales bacterium]